MRLVLFKCDSDDCDNEVEELYKRAEDAPEVFGECEKCGGQLVKDIFPRNAQVLKYAIRS